MSSVGSLNVVLAADATPLKRGLAEGESAVERFANAAKAMANSTESNFGTAGDAIKNSFRKSVTAAIRDIGSMVAPAALLSAGLTAIGAAALEGFSKAREETLSTDEIIKQHDALIRGLKSAYGDALTGLEEYTRESENSFRNRLGASITVLQAQLQGLGGAFVAGLGGTVIQNEIQNLAGEFERLGGTVVQLPSRLEPFRSAIEAFQQSVRVGNPDFVAFKNEVDRIGAAAAGSNPEVNKTAVALSEAAKQGFQAQQGIGAASSAMTQLTPEARRASEAVKGFADAIKAMQNVAPVKKTDSYIVDENYFKGIFDAKGDENKIRQLVQERNDAYARINAEEAAKNKGSKTAPADTTDYELEAEKASLTARMEALRNHLMTKDELMNANLLKNQEMIKRAGELEVGTEQERLQLLQNMNADHYARLQAIKDAANMKALTSTAEMFGSLQSVTESWGKKNTAVSKALGIAQALISTYVGATKAMEFASTAGPVAGFAAFAAVMAKGLATVAAITSVNTSGSGGNAPRSVGGGASSAGAGGGQQAPQAPQRSMYVTLQGDMFNREMVRGLLEQVQSFQKDGGGKVVFG
ncbi:MAG: hypothetical protein K2Y29_11370 [Beijerinckiaceae bacterium]|nr:hypothetical protein [Beijerinckiaceae bacterium]